MSPTADGTLANFQQIIADLRRQLAESTAEREALRRELAEGVAHQATTVEILQVINSSPGDLAPVFDEMLEKAIHLCEASFGNMFVYDGATERSVAVRGAPEFAEWLAERGRFFIPSSERSQAIEARITVRRDNLAASWWSSSGRDARRGPAALLLLAAALSPPTAAAKRTPQPAFTELFAYDPAAPSQLLGKWRISSQLDSKLQPLRVGVVEDRIGKTVGRVTVQEGDGLDGANEAMLAARHYICNREGSRAAAVEAEPGGVVPSERAEIQVRSDRATGAGELVKFGELVWYRFSFKIAGDWPQDVPVGGRQLCRTVIHQIKQDSFKDGKSCNASPFFKIEARPIGERVRFFAQVATGTPCARPPMVRRVRICQRDLPRESWTTVHVRLNPANDASGRVDIWLNGTFCGTYQGPMADRDYGARRNGTPFINAQPRFGIYRDWRAETQTIYFDKIMFWNADPSGHPDWGVSPPPR